MILLHFLLSVAVGTSCHSFHIVMAPSVPKGAKSKAQAVKKDDGLPKQNGSAGSAAAIAASVAGDWQGAINRWANKPPATCTSCNQSTHDIDRHSPDGKPKYVKWAQARTLKNLPQEMLDFLGPEAARLRKPAAKIAKQEDYKVPSGEECYHCYDTRRKHYKGKSMIEVLELRNTEAKEEDEFQNYRHDIVSEKKECKSTVKKTAFVEKGDREYERNFVSGSFEPLEKFARDRRLKAQTEQELVNIIKEKYPDYRIVINKQEQVPF